MRIAIPALDETVSTSFGKSEAFWVYEDDHGTVVKKYRVPIEGEGFDAALAALERHGADVLVCGELSANERATVAASGLLLSDGARGSTDAAALRYLGGAIACDPENNCNYCGHKHECSIAAHTED